LILNQAKWTMGLSFGKGIKEVKQINDTEVTEKTVSGRGFDISIPRFSSCWRSVVCLLKISRRFYSISRWKLYR
jgi:hypothetical protein